MYTTYKFYDEKGRRIAVFCRYISATKAELFTISCSKKDQFSKKYAREQYEKYTNSLKTNCKPTINLVEIQPEQREIQILLNFCFENYFIKKSIKQYINKEILVKNAKK